MPPKGIPPAPLPSHLRRDVEVKGEDEFKEVLRDRLRQLGFVQFVEVRPPHVRLNGHFTKADLELLIKALDVRLEI